MNFSKNKKDMKDAFSGTKQVRGENQEAVGFSATKKSTPAGRAKKNPARMGQENSLLSSVSCSPAELTGIKSKHINYKING